MKRLLAIVLMALLVLAAPDRVSAQGAAGAPDGIYRFTLDGALWRFHTDAHAARDLSVEIAVINGKPGLLCRAEAREYNRGGIALKIGDFRRDGPRLTVGFEVIISSDSYVKGGAGAFSCTLTEQNGVLAGTYTGAFTQQEQALSERAGKVTGMLVPFWPAMTPKPRFAAGEHPRLLFRRDDIPRLRRFAETPVGKALLEDLEKRLPAGGVMFKWTRNPANATPYSEGYYATGEAFLYVLTGRKEHFQRARELMLRSMSDRSGEAGGWGNAPRMSGAALAYDMLYNDLDEPTRLAMQAFLRMPTDRLTYGVQPASSDMFMFMHSAAAVVCDMAVMGDPIAEPVEPDPAKAQSIAPPDGLTIGQGVPVQAYVSGEMPREWIHLGAFADDGTDPLHALGGPAKAMPDLQTVIRHAGHEQKATVLKAAGQRLSFGHNYRPHPAWGFNLLNIKHAKDTPLNMPSVFYAYCVLEVDKERVAVARPNRPDVASGTRLWLAGVELQQGQLVKLSPGRYPLLVRVPTRPLFAAPHLADYSPGMHAEWALEHEAWLAEGKTAPLVSLSFHSRLAWLRDFIRSHVGDRGLMNELLGITDARSEAILAAGAYRNLFGADLDPTGGLAWSLPLNLHTGERYWSNDWGSAFWPVYALEGTYPEAYAPAFRHILEQRATDGTLASQPNHNVLAFINLWRLQSGPAAQDPHKAQLPLHLADKSRGMYVMRSGWGPEAVSVSAMLQTGSRPTSVFAGSFMVHRQGTGLLVGKQNLGAGFFAKPRPGHKFYPAAQLLIGTCEPDGGAVATHYQPRPDGSVSLTMRVDRFIDRGGPDSRAEGGKFIEGLRHTRAVLVDYSTASGAEAVVAVLDTVDGAGDRALRWRLPIVLTPPVLARIGGERVGKDVAPGATLVMAAARERTVPADAVTVSLGFGSDKPLPIGLTTGDITVVEVAVPPRLLTVLTVQRGNPPPIAISGDTATIGKLAITVIDGNLVVQEQRQ